MIDPGAYLLETSVELITRDGNLQRVEFSDVKALCFISENAKPNLFSEASLFERRPKFAGLWARFTFRDGDQLDGILPHNLLDWPRAGYLMAPPKAGAARQRVFVPKAALTGVELRGIVGRPAIVRSLTSRPAQPAPDGQLSMFDSDPGPGSR